MDLASFLGDDTCQPTKGVAVREAIGFTPGATLEATFGNYGFDRLKAILDTPITDAGSWPCRGAGGRGEILPQDSA